MGTLEATKICVGANDDFTLEIFGTDGSLKFDLMQPNYLEFYDNKAVGTLSADIKVTQESNVSIGLMT